MPYLDACAITRLRVNFKGGKVRQEFVIYSEHGSGYARTLGGVLNSLIRISFNWDADIYVAGHCHRLLAVSLPQLHVDGGKIKERNRLFVLSGSYYKSYIEGASSYAEVRRYNPNPLGSPEIVLRSDGKFFAFTA